MIVGRRGTMAGFAASVLEWRRASAKPIASDYDCVVIGAGAAGLAAARWLHRRGKRVVVLEARTRIGGRAWTDFEHFGAPYDVGAAWFHHAFQNPLMRFVRRRADLVRTSTSSGVFLRDGLALPSDEIQAYRAAEHRVLERVERAARQNQDTSLAAMVHDRDRWERYVVEIAASATIGADPADISIADIARRPREDDALVSGGVGALIASLAQSLDIRLSTPATVVDRSSRDISITTPAGTVRAKTCLITIPTSLLAAEFLRITPALPVVTPDIFAALPMGAFEKVAFKLARSPRLSSDFAVGFDVLESGRPHAVHVGRDVAAVLYGAGWAEAIAREGQGAKIAFGLDVLKDVYGSTIEREIVGQPLASAWRDDPWAKGSYSCALPGQVEARQVYGAIVDERIAFAGEADDTSMPSTVGGAWLSGERAARRLSARL